VLLGINAGTRVSGIDMKIFISQSQERGRALADALAKFVRIVVPTAEPWVSTADLEKGSKWRAQLEQNLEQAGAGIVCLTPENLNDRWVLFEAGALSLKPLGRLWTFVLDVPYSQIEPPLSEFQHTIPQRDDVLKMIQSISAIAGPPRKPEDLKMVFDLLWPTFEQEIDKVRQMRAPSSPSKLDHDKALAELLAHVRTISQQAWVQEKTLKMMHLFYRALFGEKTPDLKDLRELVSSGTPPSISPRVIAGAYIPSSAGLFPGSVSVEPPPSIAAPPGSSDPVT
jgi:hypothetical protein